MLNGHSIFLSISSQLTFSAFSRKCRVRTSSWARCVLKNVATSFLLAFVSDAKGIPKDFWTIFGNKKCSFRFIQKKCFFSLFLFLSRSKINNGWMHGHLLTLKTVSSYKKLTFLQYVSKDLCRKWCWIFTSNLFYTMWTSD